ncbi:MAG: hypothetical protein E7392_04480 [Ruminococcaceae bacterium]|nr:hypothetical protein [Oscillospiraceae bacterium]
MKKIILLILVCAIISVSFGVLASDEIYSQANKTAELRYELDVIDSDTVIEETPDGKKKVSVTKKRLLSITLIIPMHLLKIRQREAYGDRKFPRSFRVYYFISFPFCCPLF